MLKTISNAIKHNPVTEYFYNFYLDYKCRSVKSYNFVACTGRSGSLTLTEIFGAVDDCVNLHEPYPCMVDRYGNDKDREKYFKKMFYHLKRVYVKRAASGHQFYVETNHLFIKSFARLAIDYFGDKLQIIHLVRDPIGVARSLYKLNDIPGGTEVAKLYYLDPLSSDNIINIQEALYEGDMQHDFYKCLWYYYEIEARIAKLQQTFPRLFKFRISTSELNNRDVVLKMFNSLGMPVNMKKLNKLVGVTMNTRPNEKTRDIDLQECEAMNLKMEDLLKEKNYLG